MKVIAIISEKLKLPYHRNESKFIKSLSCTCVVLAYS